MIVAISGLRTNNDMASLEEAIRLSGFAITEILEGGTGGTDDLARVYAQKHKIPYRTFLADWKRHGLSAGPMRNTRMMKEAEALIAIWDGKSRGTGDAIRKAKARGIPLYVYMLGKS